MTDPARRPDVEGDLSRYPIPRLVFYLNKREFLGELHVSKPGSFACRIYFREGVPVYAHLPSSRDVLGRVLLERGLINEDAFNRSLQEMAATKELQGQILLRLHAIDQRGLVDGLRLQLYRKLNRLFALTEGMVTLYSGDHKAGVTAEAAMVRADPLRVIYHGVRNAYDTERMRPELEKLRGMVVSLRPGFEHTRARYGIGAEESALLALMARSPLSVEQIYRVSNLGPLETQMLVYTLWVTEALVGGAAPAAVGTSTAQAVEATPPGLDYPTDTPEEWQEATEAQPSLEIPQPAEERAAPAPPAPQRQEAPQPPPQPAAPRLRPPSEQLPPIMLGLSPQEAFSGEDEEPTGDTTPGVDALAEAFEGIEPIQLPGDDTLTTPREDLAPILVRPATSRPIVPPATSGPIVPPATSGPIVPPATSGPIIPPATSGPIVPPATSGPIVPPAVASNPFIPPSTAAEPIIPGGQIVPPPLGPGVHPLQGGIIPPPLTGAESVAAPPGAVVPPPLGSIPNAVVPPPLGSIPNAVVPLHGPPAGRSSIEDVVLGTPAARPTRPSQEARPPRPTGLQAALGGDHAQLIRKAHERIQGQSHFEVLELGRNCSPELVREAYFKLAKVYHPDRCAALGLQEIIPLAQEVFRRINEAHTVLTNLEARKAYEEELDGKDKKGEVMAALEAEFVFQKGLVFFRKKNFAEALTHFQQSYKQNQKEGEHLAWVAWTLFNDPKNDRGKILPKCKELLLKSIKLSPQNPTCHYYLGEIYLALGDNKRAKTCFSRVVELQEHHVEANRHLRIMQMRRDKAEKDKGLFGRFRKK